MIHNRVILHAKIVYGRIKSTAPLRQMKVLDGHWIFIDLSAYLRRI